MAEIISNLFSCAVCTANYLEVPINNIAAVHMLQTQNDFCGIEADLLLSENSMLRQVVVEVPAIHQVENEAQLLGCLKCICHTHNEWASLLKKWKWIYYHLGTYWKSEINYSKFWLKWKQISSSLILICICVFCNMYHHQNQCKLLFNFNLFALICVATKTQT